jgi:hypothetical protein
LSERPSTKSNPYLSQQLAKHQAALATSLKLAAPIDGVEDVMQERVMHELVKKRAKKIGVEGG